MTNLHPSGRDPESPSSAPLREPRRVANLPGLGDLGAEGVNLLASGRRRAVAAGDRLEPESPNMITLALAGVACLTEPTGLCIGLLRAGEPIGFKSLGGRAVTGVWMTPGEVVDLSAEAMAEVLGPHRMLRYCLAMSARREAAIEAELACCVRHQSAARIGRWIRRFAEATPDPITVAQSRLATLTGLQRTSVCAAMATLQQARAVKVTRGRIAVLDRSALKRLACRCGEGADRVERPAIRQVYW